MSDPIRFILAVGGLTLVICCAAFAGSVSLIVALRCVHPFNAERFTPAAWAAASDERRAAMSWDAIRHLPPGLPEDEVRSLLGPGVVEDSHRLTGSAPPRAIRTCSYYLGCWSATAYDSTFLWVHLDKEGRVAEAVIGGG
jgi:hypothetical protein